MVEIKVRIQTVIQEQNKKFKNIVMEQSEKIMTILLSVKYKMHNTKMNNC
jgi:hypothetical protein